MGHPRHPRPTTPRYPPPHPEPQRKVTDVCPLIIGILYGLIIFIVAVAVYNGSNLQRGSYPADSAGKVCQLDTNTGVNNYPFLYFNNPQDPSVDRYLFRYAATA